ncbi:hypothetical protein [Rubrivirga marina]|uniref:Lipoprotein n=1 Tax=Rubrivirga marina TaxID=1196024 RepID=A0A271IUQ3_9BACT|nr:hypothetical protein [Rubrivirga marina]PAP74966.1 hypothetical protein BSZ37_00130 [Rubrivirga marina]
MPLPLRLGLLVATLAVAGCDSVGDDALITRYSGPEITEADATVPNPPFGPAGWQASGATGTAPHVSLSRTTLCGDECSRTLTLRFAGSPRDELPSSVEGRVVVQQYNPEGRTETDLSVRRVEVQDWGPEVYSGVAVVDAGIGVDRVVFWVGEPFPVTE